MPRTTLDIEDVLLRQIKRRAAAEGRTLQAVANDLLRRGLAEPRRTAYRLDWKPSPAKMRPGVDPCDRNSLFRLFDEE